MSEAPRRRPRSLPKKSLGRTARSGRLERSAAPVRRSAPPRAGLRRNGPLLRGELPAHNLARDVVHLSWEHLLDHIDSVIEHREFDALATLALGMPPQPLERVMAGIDTLSGTAFEQLVRELLHRDAWSDPGVMGGAGDSGADVVAMHPLRGGRLVVQAKRYKAKVPSGQVQMFLGTHRIVHEASYAAIVTTSFLTKPSTKVCAEAGIEVVDRTRLGQWLVGDWHSLLLGRLKKRESRERWTV